MKTRSLLLLLLLPMFSLTHAQKAAEAVLTNGMIIRNGVSYGRNNFITDPQAIAIINNNFISPYEGKTAGTTPGGQVAAWKNISAGEKGYFRSQDLRGGALYIEYDSPEEKIMLLEASGHTMVFVNGQPREGDHYDFNFSVHPVLLKKGLNRFYFTNGRYPRIKASLTEKTSDIIIKRKDLTLPDLIIEEPGFKPGSVSLINAGSKPAEGLKIICSVNDQSLTSMLPVLEKMTSRRMNFKIPVPRGLKEGETRVSVEVYSDTGRLYDSYEFEIKVKHFATNHDRTFVSNIDGSVQYYSVRPGTRPLADSQALFLSVHGAGVQARNQAGTYDPKEWGHIVAPTNRGPFGFAWEDWGRLDALEVLDQGQKLFKTRPELTFLTGHSMGGHGTWYLGASYPDKFAAIAPCAGYPDLLNYAGQDKDKQQEGEMEKMFNRAGNPSRTLKIAPNYSQHGVYVYHGSADRTVNVEQARRMRELLGSFHPDFSYYEYPGGGHWFGDISMDWPPIFDYFKIHEIPASTRVKKIEYYTACPGISPDCHWISIYQQTRPFEISSVRAEVQNDTLLMITDTENIAVLGIKPAGMPVSQPFSISVRGQDIKVGEINLEEYLYIGLKDGKWTVISEPSPGAKGPHRYGGFKDAFRKNMVFVYGSTGSDEENSWNYHKARFDAETFSYRGNGAIEIVPDKQFMDNDYTGCNIIVYGNADNNMAWETLLADSPVQVSAGKVTIGDKLLTGADIGCYFIRPRPGSENNTVAVIAGTGIKGSKATYPNQYFIAGTSFPDLTVFRMPAINDAYENVECAGFFGNDWSIDEGDFVWKKNNSNNGR